MNTRAKDIVLGMLAVGALAFAVYFGFAGRTEKVNVDTYEVLGAITAEETAKLLGNKGQVLVMARGTGANKNPSVEAELNAFQKALRKHNGMNVVTEKVELTPMEVMAAGGGLPSDQLFKALAKHANIAAVVLFFGFPTLPDPELEALKKTGTKIVVVSSFHPGYQRLLERQAIHLAVVPRSDGPAPGATAPRTLRERFDQEYLLLTSAEATRLK